MIDQVIKLLWNRRNHQDNLIHTRLGWLIATQAFLIIAFFNAYDSANLYRWAVPQVIPIVGLLSTGLVHRSILGGIKTYKETRERLHKIIKESESEEVCKNYSNTLLDRDWAVIKWGGFLPCIFTPLVFMVFWLFLFVISLLN